MSVASGSSALRGANGAPQPGAAPRDASGPRLRGLELLLPSGLPQACQLGATATLAGLEHLAASLLRRASPSRADRLDARALARVVRTLGRLKGPYAKLGQFAAIRHDLLSERATEALGTLRDRVPPLPFARIREAVESELGADLDTCFAGFERDPLGSASVAQAHRARLPSGEPVVVKVQYPWLEASLPADLRLLRGLLGVVLGRGGNTADRAVLFDEFANGLRQELDFEHEAQVAAEIGANLAGDDAVVVPEVFPSHSTRRVLTMRHHAAVGIADREGLARLGVRPGDVLAVLARAYASQIFVDGVFHADPHPGNLFVVDEPDAAHRPRLLFVDFGLSRRLDPMLRDELRQGIYALMQRDLDAFLDGMERLDMIAPGRRPAVREAVGSMFERIQARGGALGVGGSQVLSLKDEAVALLRETEGLRLPNDLLLYAKTLSYVFALGAELDPEVDVMKLALPSLLRFLASG